MPQTYTYPTHEEMVLAFVGSFERSTIADREAGREWYDGARKAARDLAREYGLTVSAVAGIIAALSPRVQWAQNVKLAARVCRTGDAGPGSMRANADKALRIWLGEDPLAVLGGPKVRAFYAAILGDEESAVIDTWMFTVLDWPDGASRSGARYVEAAGALREAARIVEEPVTVTQATIWVEVRGRAY